jgi:hypothetical protein
VRRTPGIISVYKSGTCSRRLSWSSKANSNSEPRPSLCSSYQSNASPISRTARPANFKRYATTRFLNALLPDPRNNRPQGFAQSRPNALRVRSLVQVKPQWREGRQQCFPKSLQRVEFAPARAVPKCRQQKFGSWNVDYHGDCFARRRSGVRPARLRRRQSQPDRAAAQGPAPQAMAWPD